jgi:hypothetical protein
MAYSTVPKCRRDGVIQLRDSGGVNTLDVAYEDGNLTFSVAPKEAQNIFRDRGIITTVRRGDSAEITGSFTIHMREFTNSTAVLLSLLITPPQSPKPWLMLLLRKRIQIRSRLNLPRMGALL